MLLAYSSLKSNALSIFTEIKLTMIPADTDTSITFNCEEVRLPRLPIVHMIYVLSMVSLLKYCIILTTAEIPLASMIPRIRTVIIFFTRDEMTMTSIITDPAPTQEAAAIAQFPKPLILSGARFDENPSITNATPRLAPELSPRTYGPAMDSEKCLHL